MLGAVRGWYGNLGGAVPNHAGQTMHRITPRKHEATNRIPKTVWLHCGCRIYAAVPGCWWFARPSRSRYPTQGNHSRPSSSLFRYPVYYHPRFSLKTPQMIRPLNVRSQGNEISRTVPTRQIGHLQAEQSCSYFRLHILCWC